MDGILLFSARNDHDLYDCASKRRTGEFSLICGYFLFVDRKIGNRMKDLRMKCNSLIKDYVSISIPVFVSDSLLALGTSAVAMVMGRIGTGFVSANSITVVTQQLTTVIIQGICHASCIMTGHTLGHGEREKAQIAGELMDAIAFIVVFQSMNSILTKGVLRGGGDTKFLMVEQEILIMIPSVVIIMTSLSSFTAFTPTTFPVFSVIL